MKQISIILFGILLSAASYATVGPITGVLTVCEGSATALGNSVAGGTWSSGATGVAIVNSVTGVVTGVAAGTATITYTYSPVDHTTAIVTVNTTPSAITGTLNICTGYNTTLNSLPAGGTWTSSVPAVASIGLTSGVASAMASGNTSIIYTLPTGCATNTTLTVNTTPIVSGTGIVCLGSPAVLTTTASGTWTSSNVSFATVNAATGIVTGVAVGTAIITNTLSTGCYGTIAMTINPATTPITGASAICVASTTTLGDPTSGGTWSSSATGIATIGPASALVTGIAPGTTTITYFISATGCYTTSTFTINGALPIVGGSSLCSGLTTTYTDPTGGGTWSSSNPSIATVGSTTGVVTGIAAGTAYISYTVVCGSVVKMITITSTTPPITGIPSVCVGQTTNLGDPASGGVWNSSLTSVATVNSSTGVVNGITTGTATIFYVIGSCGSVNTTVTVNPLPANISGAAIVCGGGAATLFSDTSPGGTWTSLNTTIAVVGSSSGSVTGVTAGGTVIVYTLPTGCTKTKIITVTASPVISGGFSVCAGGTSPLTAVGGAGVWSSSTPSVAPVSPSGVVSGASLGTATISYTVTSTGCVATQMVTVTSACSGMPVAGSAHTSATSVCSGNAVSLSLTGAVVSCGVLSQWQSSPDGILWNNITGATTPDYTFAPTVSRYYRCRLTCISSGLTAFSVAVFVGVTYSVATHTETVTPSATCSPVDFYISACGTSPTLSVISYFGDGNSVATPLSTGGISFAHIPHTYSLPGTYTVKHVLFNAGTPVDSIIFTYEHLFCKTLSAQFYNDNNADCIFDAGDTYNTNPIKIEIDSSGIAIDTMIVTSGLYRKVYGTTGTVYAFRFIPGTGGMSVSCPSSGVLFDTIVSTVNNYPVRYFGLSCLGVPGYDLSVTSSMVCDPHSARCNIVVSNSYCTPVSPVVTMTFSPDYVFTSAVPAPTTVTGTTVTWNLSATTAIAPKNIVVYLDRLSSLPLLTVGDTINSTISVGPTTADVNTPNNVVRRVDTVNASYSFSDIAVAPTGYILPCDVLEYKVRFENTGFDTARDIYILDTLSPSLDPATLNVVSTSAAMKLTVINDGVENIARFDFPHINLLDSSHHGLCDGMVVFSIKAKNGLIDGTTIVNHAGIVFDDFQVLLTNNVTNTTGIGPIMGTNMVCTGTSAVVWGTPSGGTWSTSSPAITLAGDTVMGVTAGTAGITYIATNSCATRSTSKVLTINPSVIPSVTISASTPDTICSGTSSIFTALPLNVGTGATFEWKINGVSVSTSTSYSYAPVDSDQVSVTIGADTACAVPDTIRDTLMMTVITTALPVVTISVSPSDTTCLSQPVTFTATPLFGGTTPGYIWKLNGSPVGGGTSYYYVPSNGDVVYCVMGSNFMCRVVDTVTSANITMTVDPPYVPLITISVNPGLIIEAGQYDTLTANVTGAGPTPTYQWQVNGTDVPGQTSPVFISNTFHDYDSISCYVTGSGACKITAFGFVFLSVFNVGVPLVGSGDQLSVFPNPNKGDLHIRGSLNPAKDEEVNIEITDMLGQVIYSNKIMATGGKINESIILGKDLANGMYMLNLHTQARNSMFHFVVEQ